MDQDFGQPPTSEESSGLQSGEPPVIKTSLKGSNKKFLNGIIYCVLILAVILVTIAICRRYPNWHGFVGNVLHPGDTIESKLKAVQPKLGPMGSWLPVKRGWGATQDFSLWSCFVCPRCQCSCTTYKRLSPACPLCGMAMIIKGGNMALVGNSPGVMTKITSQVLPIKKNSRAPHEYMGACTNCHTILPPGSSSSSMTQVAAIVNNTRNAPLKKLIKEFGIEIRPARSAGVEVSGVMGNSFASKAGILKGDLILTLNGARVRSVDHFQLLVMKATPEADALLKVLRNERTRDIAMMVGEGDMDGFLPIK